MIAVWIALALTPSRVPDAPREDFDAGRFAEARAGYRELLESFQSDSAPETEAVGPILYNLGCCAAKLDQPAEAAWYFRRAALRMPHDAEVSENLLLAERAADPTARAPNFVDRALAQIDHLPPGELLLAILVLQGVGLFGWVVLGQTRTRRFLFAFLIASALAAGWRLAWIEGRLDRPQTGVALVRDAPVHVDPHREEGVALRLPAGACVDVLEGSTRWLRIEYAGQVGWCEASSIGLVD